MPFKNTNDFTTSPDKYGEPPDDLLVNIFTRLFAKQLAQMRSISKSWNAFLSHIHRSIRHNDKILLHFPNGEPSVAFEALVNRHLQLDNFIKLPVNPQPKYFDIRVIGAVNGLICSTYNDSFIQIWNPSLSAMITLPPYSMLPYSMPPYSIPSDGYDWIKVYFRFGFDPKADDYKVVKLTAFANESAHAVTWWMDVEIYSMRKGEWELITNKFPSHIAWIDENEVVCADGHDGRLHWLCSTTKELDPNTIMAFDLGSGEIPLPHVIVAYKYHCSKSLGVLAGKLCLMSWDGSAPCEVWVMDEYGVVDSWVKRHVFSQFTGDTYPFGFTPSNKYIIQDQYCRLVLYNPFTEEAQILKNDCSYEEYDAGKMVEYVDSLVWVAPVKHKRKRKMVDGVRLIRN